jgi:hypothetical protein
MLPALVEPEFRPVCFTRRTILPYSLFERPNAQRREEARARVTTLYGGRWSQVDSPYNSPPTNSLLMSNTSKKKQEKETFVSSK